MSNSGQRWTRPGQGEPNSEWRQRAACRGLGDQQFMPPDDTNDGRFRYGPGKVYCNRCPVRVQCALTAMRNGYLHGMWGGLTAIERGRLRPVLVDLGNLAFGTAPVNPAVRLVATLALGYLTDGIGSAPIPDTPVLAPPVHGDGSEKASREARTRAARTPVPTPRWVTWLRPRPGSSSRQLLVGFGPADFDHAGVEFDPDAGRQPALVASG